MSFKFYYIFLFIIVALYCNILPLIMDSLHWTGAQRTLFYTLIPLLTLIFNPLWGKLSDAFQSRQKFIKIASYSGTFFLFVSLFLSKENQLYGYAITLGIFGFPLLPMIDSETVEYCHQNNRHYGEFRALGTASFILTQVACFILLKYHVHVEAIQNLFLASFPICLLIIAITPHRHSITNIKNELKTKHFFEFKNIILKSSSIWLFFQIIFFHNLSFGAIFSYLGPHLSNLEMSASLISLAWAIAPILEYPVFLKGKAIFKKKNPYFILLLGLICHFIRILLLNFPLPNHTLIFSQILHSFAFGFVYLSAIDFIKQKFPSKILTFSMSLFMAYSMNLSQILGNILYGHLFDILGSHAVFCASLVFSGVSIIFYILFKRAESLLTSNNRNKTVKMKSL